MSGLSDDVAQAFRCATTLYEFLELVEITKNVNVQRVNQLGVLRAAGFKVVAGRHVVSGMTFTSAVSAALKKAKHADKEGA